MSSTPIDPAVVRRVALLARLGLGEEELERSARQLAGILGHFQALQSVDTAGVEPLVHAFDSTGIPAPDVVQPFAGARAALLPLTGHAREGFFVVPRIMDADFGAEAGARATAAAGSKRAPGVPDDVPPDDDPGADA